MSKKYEKKDLQHPVDYSWKTEFNYFWKFEKKFLQRLKLIKSLK